MKIILDNAISAFFYCYSCIIVRGYYSYKSGYLVNTVQHQVDFHQTQNKVILLFNVVFANWSYLVTEIHASG